LKSFIFRFQNYWEQDFYAKHNNIARTPEHEDYDVNMNSWFCSGWQTKTRWLETHGYLPKNQLKPVFFDKDEPTDNPRI
jgi:hypothetical protein